MGNALVTALQTITNVVVNTSTAIVSFLLNGVSTSCKMACALCSRGINTVVDIARLVQAGAKATYILVNNHPILFIGSVVVICVAGYNLYPGSEVKVNPLKPDPLKPDPDPFKPVRWDPETKIIMMNGFRKTMLEANKNAVSKGRKLPFPHINSGDDHIIHIGTPQ